jgi:cob(I)alamin adenosyltransferase
MTKIYTGGGDRGRTGLYSGERVRKDAPRIEAGGELDELNSVLGVLAAGLPDPDGPQAGQIRRIQGDLLTLGARLADTAGEFAPGKLDPRFLETAMDRLDEGLPDLTAFILPGGHPAGAWAHLARTVCRRAERRVVTLAAGLEEEGQPGLPPEVQVYLNRLSDYLFVLARRLNHDLGAGDVPWRP